MSSQDTPDSPSLDDDPAYDPSLTSPSALQLSSSLTHTREVSMIEKGKEHVGVVFTPSLAEQRIAWVLQVLRKENVRSVLDVGCGEGELLRILSRPSSTIPEEPILDPGSSSSNSTPTLTSKAIGLKRLRSQSSETPLRSTGQSGGGQSTMTATNKDDPSFPLDLSNVVVKDLFIHVSQRRFSLCCFLSL
jgi:hypothetical protein